MPSTTPTATDAGTLARAVHQTEAFSHVKVEAKRGHLYIYPDDSDPVARITPIDRAQYGISFHSHTGRWEPMPYHGDLAAMAKVLTSVLAPYLASYNAA